MRIIEDVLNILELSIGCTLDILEKAFFIASVEVIPEDEQDPDELLPEYPTPPSQGSVFPGEATAEGGANPPSPAATHLIQNAPKDGAVFFKTLPWETNEVYGTVGNGQTFVMMDTIIGQEVDASQLYN